MGKDERKGRGINGMIVSKVLSSLMVCFIGLDLDWLDYIGCMCKQTKFFSLLPRDI